MGNLASTYRNQGRGVQVTETSLRVLGQEHPDTLNSMGILASTFWNQGRWKEAEELDVQVMETRKKGQEHLDTLTASAAVRIGPMLSHHQNAVLYKRKYMLRCSDAESSPKRCFDRERDRMYERKYIAPMLRR
jgi:hypothetical protein